MSKSQGTGKKWPLILILCGLVIAMVIACLASPLSPLKISLETTVVSFLIIYTIVIVIFIIMIFSDKLRSGILRDVVNFIKSHPGYFFPPFMFLMALGFTFLLSDFLYKFLCMSSISELLQFYPMLFAGAITSVSIMFAVTYWVANRAENIAELAVTIQYIKIFAMANYILVLFSVFVPLYIIPSPSNYTSTLLLYIISFLLSYPFGLTASIVQALIILDVLAVTLRHELSEK